MENDKQIDYYNCLDFFDNNKNEKLMITKNNARFIEAALKIDSRYKDSSNPNKKPSKEYVDYLKNDNIDKYNDKIHQYGSSKYWINKLVEIIESGDISHTITDKEIEFEKKSRNTKIDDTLDLKTIIKGTVCAIDRENSTHLTAHVSKNKTGRSKGRSNVSNVIYDEMKKGLKNFKDRLIGEKDFSLIGIIAVPTEKNKENYHYSFATKFCKYVCIGIDEKIDKYFIYDNIIISNINYYIEKYELDQTKFNEKTIRFERKDFESDKKETQYLTISEKYESLWDCLEEIIKVANKNANKKKDKVTRNELDHIIWYSNK